jgi:ATP-dependent Clp protease adaptor protein ClpS
MSEQTPGTTGDVLEKTREQLKTPERWRVLLLNDDYTPMDFVVQVLETIFMKSPAEAYRIMMQVHTQGSGLAGVYTHDVAETKVGTVIDLAQQAGYPLQAAMEKE